MRLLFKSYEFIVDGEMAESNTKDVAIKKSEIIYLIRQTGGKVVSKDNIDNRAFHLIITKSDPMPPKGRKRVDYKKAHIIRVQVRLCLRWINR